MRCAYSFSRHAPRMPWEPSSPAAEHGVAVHSLGEAIVEAVVEGIVEGIVQAMTEAIVDGVIECSPEVEPYRDPLTEAIAMLRAEGWVLAAEVPMAYWPATGSARALKKGGGHRAYADVKSHEMSGTADIVGVKPGRVIVVDIKTGRSARSHSALETDQLRMLAVGFAAIYGATSVEVALLHVEPGDYYLDRGELYAWDLEETADSLRALAEMADPVPTPGMHCTTMWCPIRAVCPATLVAVQRIDAEVARAFPGAMTTVDSDDKARAARVALLLYDERADALKASLDEYIRHRGAVDMGDGTSYGLTVQERERVTLDASAVQTLVDHGALEAVEYRTSKEAIKRSLAARYPGRGKSIKRFRDLLDALRAAGHVRTSAFERFDSIKNNSKQSDSYDSNEEENAA